jgi:hypothetical protein
MPPTNLRVSALCLAGEAMALVSGKTLKSRAAAP